MKTRQEGDGPEPSLSELILRGALIIVGAFVSAWFILVLQQPVGH